MYHDDSPLFLAVRYNIDYNTESIWYHAKPLGKNSIGEFLSKASVLLSSSKTTKGKVANHSARKTAITDLLNENIHPIHVSQLSGHKKLESLNLYNVASTKQHKNISRILSLSSSSTNMSSVSNNNTSLFSQQSSVLSENVQQEMMQNWNPVLPPTFHGAYISNCTFNINISLNSSPPPSKKRKRVIIDDDSQ